MKVGKKIRKLKRDIALAKFTHKSFRLYTAYRGCRKLKKGLDNFLTPKYKR